MKNNRSISVRRRSTMVFTFVIPNLITLMLINVPLVNAAEPSCTSCTTGTITFTQSTGAGTITPTFSGPNAGNGCLTLTAVCPASSNTVFMQFNTNQGGPAPPTNIDITAVLNCVNGQWVYAPTGQESRIIREINCIG